MTNEQEGLGELETSEADARPYVSADIGSGPAYEALDVAAEDLDKIAPGLVFDLNLVGIPSNEVREQVIQLPEGVREIKVSCQMGAGTLGATPPLFKFDPIDGIADVYPSEARQYREYHGQVAWLFDPFTGVRRDARDVGSDPFGLMVGAPAPGEGGAQ